MNINPGLGPQWIAAPSSVRGITAPIIPQQSPVAPLGAPSSANLDPQAALRDWLAQYSRPGDSSLYDRVAADPTPEGTLFRRGLMISGVVNLTGG